MVLDIDALVHITKLDALERDNPYPNPTLAYLIDNALDAQSTTIAIAIDAAAETVTVRDDGCGMTIGTMAEALSRSHAGGIQAGEFPYFPPKRFQSLRLQPLPLQQRLLASVEASW